MSSINNGTFMHDLNNAKFALLSIFPVKKSYFDFKDDAPKISKNAVSLFIQYAKLNGLIINESEEDFIAFIDQNSAYPDKLEPSVGYTFPEILDEALGRKSVNSLINRLNNIAEKFNMMKVLASMFSRLKKDFNPNTTKKRNILRLFSFWLGLNQPQLGWNYEMLRKLPRFEAVELTYKEKEGVRVAFSLRSMGDIINNEAVEWLQKELKKCINDLELQYINWKKISFTLSTAYLNIPKKSGPSKVPRLYQQAILDCLSITHQMAVRWILSDYCESKIILYTAIAAGEFDDNLETSIQALLSAKLKNDPPIRLTDFAYLCARISGAKIIFYKDPKEIETYTGNSMAVWTVKSFWSYFFYHFIPKLLEENSLPTTKKSFLEFKSTIYSGDSAEKKSFKALSAFYKFPNSSLLGLEIVKVLIARRMFYEADEIISIILSLDSNHLIARCNRLEIYRHLTITQNDMEVSCQTFKRGLDESLYIEKYCVADADAFSLIGLLHFSRAIQLLVFLRKKNTSKNMDISRKVIMDDIMVLLQNADLYFRKGRSISAIFNIRIEYWIKQAGLFMKLLTDCKTHTDICNLFVGVDNNDHWKKISFNFWKAKGWIDEFWFEKLTNLQVEEFLNRLLNEADNFFKTSPSSHFVPSAKFIFAMELWDNLPIISVGIAKLLISMIEDSIRDANKLKKYGIGVFSNVSCFSQIQGLEHFIECAEKTIAKMKAALKDDLLKEDSHQVKSKKINSFKIIALNFDEEVKPGVIVNNS